MRISTIMAVYNCERYVAQALESVIAQTMPSDEIVVVDDGSTDGTPEILQAFGKYCRIIRQQNFGPARALNAGIVTSTGDAFAFLDSDDLWLPNKLRLQSAALAANDNVDALFGAVEQFVSPDLHSDIVGKYVVPEGPQPGITKNTMLIRRSAFERIGLFDEGYRMIDFVDWYARATVLGLNFRVLPEVVALRRHHPGNSGRLLRSTQHNEVLLALKRSLDMRRAGLKIVDN